MIPEAEGEITLTLSDPSISVSNQFSLKNETKVDTEPKYSAFTSIWRVYI